MALRILVADDNDDSWDTMRYPLETEGHAVVTAADGTSVMAAFEQFLPEVVILDVGMRGLSGYTVPNKYASKAISR